MRRDLYEPDHEAFREVVQAYVKREVTPNQERWEQEHIIDRQAWLAAGKQSIIGLLIPERFGGAGIGVRTVCGSYDAVGVEVIVVT